MISRFFEVTKLSLRERERERPVQDLFYNSHTEYTFHTLAIPREIALPAVFNVCPRAHNPLVEAGAHSYRDTFFEVPASPDICRRIMLLKGDCVARRRDERKREAETCRKEVESRTAENVQARADAGRFVSWNGVAPFSAVAKKSSRTSCIPFFPPALSWQSRSYTWGAHTG